MSTALPDDINPFRAPESAIGAPPVLDATADDEAIRRANIGREASIKSVGLLCYLNAAISTLSTASTLMLAVGALQRADPDRAMQSGIAVASAVVMGAFTVAYGAVGYGLRRLLPWARWTTIVLMGLALLYLLVVTVPAALMNPFAGLFVLLVSLIPGYILYLVASAKGALVFSPEYREVIRRTPHIKYKTGLLVKVLLAVLLALVLVIIAAALFGGVR